MRKAVAKKLYSPKGGDYYTLTQPFTVRLFHWGFALSMTIVVFTGLVLHYPFPFLALNFGKVFVVHLSAGFTALGFLLLRLADMALRRDTSILPHLTDLKSFPKLMAYYLFIKPSPPPSGKYNSAQKLLFTSWITVALIAIFFGIMSYWIENFPWVLRLTGGAQGIKLIKFGAAAYFAVTVPVHLYLVFTQDPSRLQAIVTGYERLKPRPPK